MKIKVIALFIFLLSTLCAQDTLNTEKPDPENPGDIESEQESKDTQADTPDDGFPSNVSSFYDSTYIDPLQTDRQFGFYAFEEAELFSFPQPDDTFTWGLDFYYRMKFILVSNDMSLTAEPCYSFATGGIPGTSDQNAFSLYRLYGSLFFSDDMALQVGFLNAEQGVTNSTFNPFAWNKKTQFFRSNQDQEPWLGASFKSPVVRAFYVYNPDLTLSAGSLSANFFPGDLISGGFILERLSGNVNRTGGYLVSKWGAQDFTLQGDYSAAFYFNDAVSGFSPEMNGSISLYFNDFYGQAGFYWNGRRETLNLDPASPDPYGYLGNSAYAYGKINYSNDQFMISLNGIGNLSDGSVLAMPSFTFATSFLENLTMKIKAEFPLVFGAPGSELYELIPSSYCAVMKVEFVYNLNDLW